VSGVLEEEGVTQPQVTRVESSGFLCFDAFIVLSLVPTVSVLSQSGDLSLFRSGRLNRLTLAI
jgi:hypothetical protein